MNNGAYIVPLLLYTGVMKNDYKIGDKVIVSFLSNDYSSEIIDVKRHPHQERIIYTARTSAGLTIPYVGIDGSERYANIYTDKTNSKIIKNGNKRQTKRKSNQDHEEAS